MDPDNLSPFDYKIDWLIIKTPMDYKVIFNITISHRLASNLFNIKPYILNIKTLFVNDI
jgi:hypothetical protein